MNNIVKEVPLFFVILLSAFLFYCSSSKPKLDSSHKQATLNETSMVSNLNDKIAEVSTKIYETMLEENRHKVAVLTFTTLQGKQCDLGFYITDKLTNNLFIHRDKFEVVDRIHIDEVILELKLSEAGAIEQASLKKLGKFLGADVVVVGNFSIIDTYVDVTVRALDVEKMSVLAVADAQIFRSKEVEELLDNCGIKKLLEADTTYKEPFSYQTTSSDILSISYYGKDESFVGKTFEFQYNQNHQDFRIEAKTLPSEHVGELFWQLDSGLKQKINKFKFRVPNYRDGGHILTIGISYLDFNNIVVRKEVKTIELIMTTSRLQH